MNSVGEIKTDDFAFDLVLMEKDFQILIQMKHLFRSLKIKKYFLKM